MRPNIEFWFDFSCPFAYIGSLRIEALAERTGATLDLRPMLLGGVFRARNVPQFLAGSLPAAKAAHNAADIRRYAALHDVPLEMPAAHPIRTVDALRTMLAAGPPYNTLMHAYYKAYWVDGIDISTVEGRAEVLNGAGYVAAELEEKAKSEEVRQSLFERTDEAIQKGIFGAPAMVVDSTLYWGQDRYDMIERALGGRPDATCVASEHDGEIKPVDFYFDYTSSYSYVAVHAVDALFGDAVRYRPMLLGGVWSAVNKGALELAGKTTAKTNFLGADFRRHCAQAGLPMKWPEPFPTRTMLALRVTLEAGVPKGLVHRIFRAYWAEGRDIASADVIQELCDAEGLKGAHLVERASDPEVKKALRDATSAAIDAGVFGAPTFIVHTGEEEPSLYWGNDRLDLAVRASRGDTKLY